MPPLPLSFNEQTIKSALNGYDPKFHVVTEPVARNSRPYDGRPTCCGNNNCMPICPIGAMSTASCTSRRPSRPARS